MEKKNKKEWMGKLRAKVISAYQRTGSKSPTTLAEHCEGASPQDIKKIIDSLQESDFNEEFTSIDFRAQNKFFFQLPAPNPEFFQWWYTLESQEKLISIITDSVDIKSQRGLCIGTPTAAAYLKSMDAEVTLIDIDSDVVECFQRNFKSNSSALTRDIFDGIEQSMQGQFDYVVIDPPWYQSFFQYFINSSIDALKDDGLIFCSIPKVLTRPGVDLERENLINKMSAAGHELYFLEKGTICYVVPIFEEEVLSKEDVDFELRPWRSSDLIVFKVTGDKKVNLVNESEFEKKTKVMSYSKDKTKTLFRVFLELNDYLESAADHIEKVPKYSTTISKRDACDKFNLWTSNKNAYLVKNHNTAKVILEEWQSGTSYNDVAQKLVDSKCESSLILAEKVLKNYEEALLLWEDHSDASVRRTDKQIKEALDKLNNDKLSAVSSKREHENSDDGFRIEFQRDRDRVIWSSGFRKLSDKTQLFPLDEDEHLRQRLAHSIEVSQLASTIAASFGLNQDLVEAGALAHDIGHTPFGHAGEFALNVLLSKHLKIACGFNHYEHGVDVVRYLEAPYQNRGFDSFSGLDLTPEVCDCILKHTYCHHGGEGSEAIYAKSKHQKFIANKGHCHLEGQAVRAADKISYLLSDIEDGIKLGSVGLQDLLSCRLFHRPPMDFRLKAGESLHLKFLEQRGSLIKLLMEDVILESSKRLSKIKSPKQVLEQADYCIYHSASIDSDMDEVWNKIQVKKLHNDPRVLSANLNASKMVSNLTLLFIAYPGLINDNFRSEHERLKSSSPDYIQFYEKGFGSGNSAKVSVDRKLFDFLSLDRMIGDDLLFKGTGRDIDIPIYNIILAKDYVAGLTDKKIEKLYKELVQK